MPKGGHIYLPAGKHNLSAGFTGWSLPKYTTVTMAPTCGIFVPDSYAGYVFGMIPASAGGTYIGSMVEGGYIREFSGAGANADHLWSAFRLECGNPGGTTSVDFVTLQHINVAYAKNGIEFLNNSTDGSGWINGNTFIDLTFADCENGINFNNNGRPVEPTGGYGFTNRNNFIGMHGQAGNVSIYGVKDIIGKMNIFIDCTMWDLHAFANSAIARSSTVVAGSKRNCFIGGSMASYRFKDDVGDTIMIDDTDMYLPGIITKPSLRRWGAWMGTSSTNGSSSGVMSAGVTVSGTGTQQIDVTNGTRQRFTTTAADVSPAGFRYAVVFTYRAFNPRLLVKFSLQQTTNQRLWIGLCNFNTLPTANTWTDLKHFFGLALRSTDTNFQIAHNAGTATTTWVSTGTAVNTAVHTIETIADNTNARWGYLWDSAKSPTWISTNLPATNTSLAFVAILETAEVAAKSIELYNVEVESDK